MGEVKGVWLGNEPIDVAAWADCVKDARCGGVVTFTGEVRGMTGALDTVRLVYEAHEPMALSQMTKIATDAATRWDANVAIAHRLGELLPGEVAVICVAACAHRAAAFECCRYLIDEIKRDVPVWKKEFGTVHEAWIAGDRRV